MLELPRRSAYPPIEPHLTGRLDVGEDLRQLLLESLLFRDFDIDSVVGPQQEDRLLIPKIFGLLEDAAKLDDIGRRAASGGDLFSLVNTILNELLVEYDMELTRIQRSLEAHG